MEVIGVLLLLGTFCLGLVLCYIFIQSLNTMRNLEKHQEETSQKLSQIQGRLEELGRRNSGEEIQKSET
jgi:hypothetical protein